MQISIYRLKSVSDFLPECDCEKCGRTLSVNEFGVGAYVDEYVCRECLNESVLEYTSSEEGGQK